MDYRVVHQGFRWCLSQDDKDTTSGLVDVLRNGGQVLDGLSLVRFQARYERAGNSYATVEQDTETRSTEHL